MQQQIQTASMRRNISCTSLQLYINGLIAMEDINDS